ncbi:MAG: hypothetical protein DDT41_00599 [candidate division WS2 bacterium]|nr:hypothetical protein [Candidatus Psychracetigena formicireducens]
MYLERVTDDKANGFYERDLLTTLGPIEDLRVPLNQKWRILSYPSPSRRRA